MERARLFVLAVAVASGLGFAASEASSPPATYYGIATAGDLVEVRRDGAVCESIRAAADGFWLLTVAEGGPCGLVSGARVSFFLNGVDSGASEVWNAGGGPANRADGVVLTATGARPSVPAKPVVPSARPFSGETPPREGMGLLVTARETEVASLRTSLKESGCQVAALAVVEGGAWRIYIEGAPAPVNASFPGRLATTLPFFVRC